MDKLADISLFESLCGGAQNNECMIVFNNITTDPDDIAQWNKLQDVLDAYHADGSLSKAKKKFASTILDIEDYYAEKYGDVKDIDWFDLFYQQCTYGIDEMAEELWEVGADDDSAEDGMEVIERILGGRK